MLKIYHAPGTRSVRPIWLCYELGLDVDVQFVDFSPDFLGSAAWRAISPAGKIPVLVDDNLAMFESGAMVDYIIDAYGGGRLVPGGGAKEMAAYRQWCWFAEATLIRPLGLYRVLKGRNAPVDELVSDAEDKFHKAMEAVERALDDERTFMTGDEFTGADIMMGYSIALVDRLMRDSYPRSRAYLERMQARPAYQKAASLSREPA